MSQNSVLVNSLWGKLENGAEVLVDGQIYTIGSTAFATLDAALAAGVTSGIATITPQNVTFPYSKNGNKLVEISSDDFASVLKEKSAGAKSQVSGAFKGVSRSSVTIGADEDGDVASAYGYSNATVKGDAGYLEAGNISTSLEHKTVSGNAATQTATRVSTTRLASGSLNVDGGNVLYGITTVTDANNNLVGEADDAFNNIAGNVSEEIADLALQDVAYADVTIKNGSVNDDIEGGKVVTYALEEEKTNASGSSRSLTASVVRASLGSATVSATLDDAEVSVGDISNYRTVVVESTVEGADVEVGNINGLNISESTVSSNSLVNDFKSAGKTVTTASATSFGTVAVSGKNMDDVTVDGDIIGYKDVDVKYANVNGAVSGYSQDTSVGSTYSSTKASASAYAVSDKYSTKSRTVATGSLTAENAVFDDSEAILFGDAETNYLLNATFGDGVTMEDERSFASGAKTSDYNYESKGYSASLGGNYDTNATYATKQGGSSANTVLGSFTATFSKKESASDSSFVLGDITGYKDVTVENVGTFEADKIDSYAGNSSWSQAVQQTVSGDAVKKVTKAADSKVKIASGTLEMTAAKDSSTEYTVGTINGVNNITLKNVGLVTSNAVTATNIKGGASNKTTTATSSVLSDSQVVAEDKNNVVSMGDFSVAFDEAVSDNNLNMEGKLIGYDDVDVINANLKGGATVENYVSANKQTSTVKSDYKVLSRKESKVSSATGSFDQTVTDKKGNVGLFEIGALNGFRTVNMEGVSAGNIIGGNSSTNRNISTKGQSDGSSYDYNVTRTETVSASVGTATVNGIIYTDDQGANPEYLNSSVGSITGFDKITINNTNVSGKISAGNSSSKTVADTVAGATLYNSASISTGSLTADAALAYYEGSSEVPAITGTISSVADVDLVNYNFSGAAVGVSAYNKNLLYSTTEKCYINGSRLMDASGSFSASTEALYAEAAGQCTIDGRISGYEDVNITNMTSEESLAICNGGSLISTFKAGLLVGKKSGHTTSGSVNVKDSNIANLSVAGYTSVDIDNAVDAEYVFGEIRYHGDVDNSTVIGGCQYVNIHQADGTVATVNQFFGTDSADKLTFTNDIAESSVVLNFTKEDEQTSFDFGEGYDTIYFGQNISDVEFNDDSCLDYNEVGLGIGLDYLDASSSVVISGLDYDKFMDAVNSGYVSYNKSKITIAGEDL